MTVTLAACGMFGRRDESPTINIVGPAAERGKTTGESDSSSAITPKAKQQPELTFFDSSAFDDDLSETLRNSRDEVKVVSPEQFGLNKIPPRMQKWLSAVSSSGGEVKAIPASSADMQFRGIPAGVLVLARELYNVASDVIHDMRTYRSANDYDAVLVYDDETGMVTRVSFVPRASGPST